MDKTKVDAAYLKFQEENKIPAYINAVPQWRTATTILEIRLAYYLSLEKFLIEEGYL